MKKLYFVHHGSTESIEKNEFHYGTSPLSSMGLKQAEFVAERFKTIPIDIIISSDIKRASQTAEAVSLALNKKVIHSNLFQEVLRPSAMRGKKKDDPEVIKIIEDIEINYENQNWRHSDEENFFDAKSRALKCLEFLESLKEENILVVTYGQILKMLIAVMGLGDTVTSGQFKLFQQFLVSKNTGVTVVDEHKGKYFLMTWNDYAHLGDADIKHVYS